MGYNDIGTRAKWSRISTKIKRKAILLKLGNTNGNFCKNQKIIYCKRNHINFMTKTAISSFMLARHHRCWRRSHLRDRTHWHGSSRDLFSSGPDVVGFSSKGESSVSVWSTRWQISTLFSSDCSWLHWCVKTDYNNDNNDTEHDYQVASHA